MQSGIQIVKYQSLHRPAIRMVLTKIGWAEQYIKGAEEAADAFSTDQENSRGYIALLDGKGVGFLSVQYYSWNQLAQIHSLAVDPELQRRGVPSTLVAQAESFAKKRNARGLYLDTPVTNEKARCFYEAIGFQSDMLCRVIRSFPRWSDLSKILY